MININPEIKTFQANAIFLQPTFGCEKNCNGCYVKAHESKFGQYKTDAALWQQILWEVALGLNIKTNQVTLALDTLPLADDKQTEIMLDIYNQYVTYAYSTNKYEAHITVNHINDLLEYISLDSMDSYVRENIAMLSISNINSPSQLMMARKLFPKAKINWNILSTSLVSMSTEKIKSIISSVDSVYLLLHKAPLGETGHHLWALTQAWKKIKEITADDNSSEQHEYASCPVPGLSAKIHVDGCINDAIKFNRSGFGCSSNISRFQIWPDGRVTGCAYNSNERYGKEAKSILDVIQNLKEARTRYEFNSCTIPVQIRKK